MNQNALEMIKTVINTSGPPQVNAPPSPALVSCQIIPCSSNGRKRYREPPFDRTITCDHPTVFCRTSAMCRLLCVLAPSQPETAQPQKQCDQTANCLPLTSGLVR